MNARSNRWWALAPALTALSIGGTGGLATSGCQGAVAPAREQRPPQPQALGAGPAAEGAGALDEHDEHDEPEDAPAAVPEDDREGGAEALAATSAESAPRIGALGYHVWIMPRPSHEGLALGKLRMGTSVAMRQPERVAGDGCAKGWRAVQPRGFVCLNRHTTLELQAPYFRALAELAPEPGARFPYHYAYSRGAPMYSRVPAPDEWQDAEKRLGPPGTFQVLGEWAAGHEELLQPDAAIAGTDPIPWFFAGGKRRVEGGSRDARRLVWKTIPNGSMLAYARAFAMHGRTWLVTPDLMLVPADRVQQLRRSTFHGVTLDDEVKLPLLFNREHAPVPLYRKDDKGAWQKADDTIAGKGWVMIDDKREGPRSDPYWPVRDKPGLYARGSKKMTVSWPRKKLPRAIKPGEKWIDARIMPGTLTAYEGLRPVYATLFSPGKGGAPVEGLDHTKYATTQTGYFRFEWKERVATMSNEKGEPKVLWFSDVPNIQYIRAPLAMHVAYWHEDFGMPKSAECVNLSPQDGQWLFGFTDPPLPKDWGAVRPGGGNGRSTPIIINGL